MFLFTGRDEDIAMLVNYLNNPHNREFFTIYGETGSGKTCLISKLLLEVSVLCLYLICDTGTMKLSILKVAIVGQVF